MIQQQVVIARSKDWGDIRVVFDFNHQPSYVSQPFQAVTRKRKRWEVDLEETVAQEQKRDYVRI
jgi:hypothetical protein